MKERFEIGFLKYIEILRMISSDPGILLITSSAICIGSACLFTYRFSKNPTLSIMLYILLGAYFSQMNVMRQAIAMSILEISFIVLVKSKTTAKTILSVLLIILASSFHTVAIIGLIPWIFIIFSNDIKHSVRFTAQNMLGATILLSVIAFIAYPIIMGIALKLFPAYSGYFSGKWSDSNYNASLFNSLIHLSFGILGVVVFGNRKLDRNQKFAAIMLSLAILFNVLSMRMEIWGRIAGLFRIYTYLIWAPEVTSQIRKPDNRVIVYALIILFSSAYMLITLIFRPEWTLVVPYYFR